MFLYGIWWNYIYLWVQAGIKYAIKQEQREMEVVTN